MKQVVNEKSTDNVVEPCNVSNVKRCWKWHKRAPTLTNILFLRTPFELYKKCKGEERFVSTLC